MSAIRKIVLSAVTMFLGLSAMFVATGTALADTAAAGQPYSVECDNDWHTPCP